MGGARSTHLVIATAAARTSSAGVRRWRPRSVCGPRASVSALVAIAVTVLAGCATVPTAPSVMVLPGQGKTFEEFQADDASCRQSATQAVAAVQGSGLPSQYRFDMVYMQCMYASGHQVPGPGGRSGYTAQPPGGGPAPTTPSDV